MTYQQRKMEMPPTDLNEVHPAGRPAEHAALRSLGRANTTPRTPRGPKLPTPQIITAQIIPPNTNNGTLTNALGGQPVAAQPSRAPPPRNVVLAGPRISRRSRNFGHLVEAILRSYVALVSEQTCTRPDRDIDGNDHSPWMPEL